VGGEDGALDYRPGLHLFVVVAKAASVAAHVVLGAHGKRKVGVGITDVLVHQLGVGEMLSVASLAA
jgi:hypothetical protein